MLLGHKTTNKHKPRAWGREREREKREKEQVPRKRERVREGGIYIERSGKRERERETEIRGGVKRVNVLAASPGTIKTANLQWNCLP